MIARLAVLSAILALAGAPGPAAAQEARPAANRGVSEQLLASIDLGKEDPALAGRSLRMRIVSVAPGGVFAHHSHAARPALVYVLSGRFVDHAEGMPAREVGPGQALAEGRQFPAASAHWGENKGGEPARLLVVDLLRQP